MNSVAAISCTIGGTRLASFVCVLLCFPIVGNAHNEDLHKEITAQAFISSKGAAPFLSQFLGVANNDLTSSPLLRANPHPLETLSIGQSCQKWLVDGSYFEDMTYYGAGPVRNQWRCTEHFYAPLPQVHGLTDNDDSPWYYLKKLPSGITNSFAWASIQGIQGISLPVVSVGANTETWVDARDHLWSALTAVNPPARQEQLALSLFALGHVLHLNQDLSSPDHTRNDSHKEIAFFENHGLDYLAAARTSRAAYQELFPRRSHGWAYWQQMGIQKLENFWNTHKYVGQAAALEADRKLAPGEKLGLAELVNGNFLGEDATYTEYFPPSETIHRFPLPSLITGTTFPAVNRRIATGVAPTFLRDGTGIQQVKISKINEGIHVDYHSILTHSGVVGRGGKRQWKVSSTIQNTVVLSEYHSFLIPKAIDYSTGIIDYFFRGRIIVTCKEFSGADVHVCFKNYSGTNLLGGTLAVYADNDQGSRTLVQNWQWPNMRQLADGASTEVTFQTPPGTVTNYTLAYRGTIGAASDGTPSDPVDARIAIAMTTFLPPGPNDTCQPHGEKRVIAMRAWHGAQPFTYDPSRTYGSWTSFSQPTTRYLTATGSGTWSTTGPEEYWNGSATSRRSATVNGISGRVDGAGDDSTQGGDGTEVCLPKARALAIATSGANPAWLQGLYNTAVTVHDVPSAHNGPAITTHVTDTPTHQHVIISFPYNTGDTSGTHAFVEAEWDGAAGTYWSDFQGWGFDNTTRTWIHSNTGNESATLAATSSHVEGWGGDGDPNGYSESWVGDGSLSTANSWDSVNNDVDALLATWNLADDVQFPWTSCCSDAPVVSRNEASATAPTTHTEPGNWSQDPLVPRPFAIDGVAEGAIYGSPVPADGPIWDNLAYDTSPFAHGSSVSPHYLHCVHATVRSVSGPQLSP